RPRQAGRRTQREPDLRLGGTRPGGGRRAVRDARRRRAPEPEGERDAQPEPQRPPAPEAARRRPAGPAGRGRGRPRVAPRRRGPPGPAGRGPQAPEAAHPCDPAGRRVAQGAAPLRYLTPEETMPSRSKLAVLLAD